MISSSELKIQEPQIWSWFLNQWVCLVYRYKLIEFLAEEASQSNGVHREIASVKYEFESIQSFLKEADKIMTTSGGDNHSDGFRTWVKQFREEAFHIEDVIDAYIFQKTKRSHGDRIIPIGVFYQFYRLVKNYKFRHDMISEIKNIRLTVCEIKERSERYRFEFNLLEQEGSRTQAQNRMWNDPRMASIFLEEADVVGIETPRSQLVGWLTTGSSRRTVISVVGMGGLGKTTLTKKVYDDHRVTCHFDCLAWVSVSQSYDMSVIMRTIIKQFFKARKELMPEGFDTTDEELLIRFVREYIYHKRYMIVFDDVWDLDFCGIIEHAFPDNNKGGRIVITTRIKDIAIFCKRSSFVHIQELQPLPAEKAWELFCRKAFQFDSEGKCPPPLMKLSLEIVDKCQGLPLAVVSIGGLLSTKDKVVSEWQKLKDSLSSELESNPHLVGISKILSLSYQDLPYDLKSCFLYFGIFPEGHSINCARLVKLWIAEGFIKSRKDKAIEEIAQEYLTQLIHRSLIQVSLVSFEGKARKCGVHDLFHEIIIKKMEDTSFCLVLRDEYECSHFHGRTRRLSINRCSLAALADIKHSPVRSLFMFDTEEFPQKLLLTLLANFKLLRVLDFENSSVAHLPNDVGILFHLRYLSLRNTKVDNLPKSISKLQNLDTLDLKNSMVYEIPKQINRLLNLRYLAACRYDYDKDFGFTTERGMKIQEGVGRLTTLQKLYHLEANHGGTKLISELRNLRQLRKLGIKHLRSEDGRILCTSIEAMKHLESFEVSSLSEEDFLDLNSITSPPKSLRRLYLRGQLRKLPDWIGKLENLVKVRIFWSRLKNSPLKALENLPSLLELGFSYKAYDGEELRFEEGGFQKLKVLKLKDLERLSSLVIEEGALLVLQDLQIGPSPQMKEVPFGIQHLRKLVSLRFINMADEFEASMDPKTGKSYGIVKHIPSVLISHKVGSKQDVYDTYNLQYHGNI
ncbi:disease resistance protein RPM1-like [Senna tora]|uniref:Disease resistance protein RPM1-like n=1 Tax=Senna tora TaxID=362788 RepID=A0A834X0W1_9FABA|nr:disease resistance protein RPM1-like [Senna tora]